MEKIQKCLNDYLSELKIAPAQRTPEWFAIKKNTIGGSEVATVIGLNPFSTVKDLIANKLGINNFNGNPATRWGTLFEKVTEEWTATVLKVEEGIKETGSIEGKIKGQRYSPDGLGVVNLLNSDDMPEYYIILFEFKSPFRSLPNGKIPKHYSPQIQTGLLSIPISDYGIFVNNCYRKCSLEDLYFNGDYDKNYHSSDYKKRKYGLEKEIPYACGIIFLYQNENDYKTVDEYFEHNNVDFDTFENFNNFYTNELDDVSEIKDSDTYYYKNEDIDILLNSKNKLIDLGMSNSKIFNRVLELYDDKKIFPLYYPMILNYGKIKTMDFISTHNIKLNQKNTSIEEYINTSFRQFNIKCKKNNYKGIGYIPWKLMRSDIILEEHDVEWENKIREPIECTLKTINELQNSENPIDSYYEKYLSVDCTEDFSDDIKNFNSIF